eukprot:3601926-Rhodomonas_salina.1
MPPGKQHNCRALRRVKGRLAMARDQFSTIYADAEKRRFSEPGPDLVKRILNLEKQLVLFRAFLDAPERMDYMSGPTGKGISQTAGD